MHAPNIVALLVAAVAVFMLGGLWYSPLMFANKWVALQGKTMEEMKAQGGASPGMFVQVFLCGLVLSWMLAGLLHMLPAGGPMGGWLGGVHLAAMCWFGFVAPTSYGTALFSSKPKALWAIDAGYNLVSMLAAGAILGAWR